MEKIIAVRNSRSETVLKIEKTAYIFLGLLTYIAGHIKAKLFSSDNSDKVLSNRKTARMTRDRETALADFCAVSVAFTVASVVYVTMLFCVGKGYSNGIGTEFLVSGGIFAGIYSVIRFLTSIR